MAAPVTLLLDNGSLQPAATLRLRELAAALGERLAAPVFPVSLLHSSGVAPEALGGRPAEIFEPFVRRRSEEGDGEFLVLPLFFGPSRALTDYLPERVAHLRTRHPRLRVRLAPTLADPGDPRLARILADHIRQAGETGRVALVDHGSPARAVTAVRDQLAQQLASELGPGCAVAACSMERRPGPDYDFCEPLLEHVLARPGWSEGAVTVAMQFLLPGRHAGPEGDVAQICRRAERTAVGLRTRLTALVGDHPRLVEILADRARAEAVPV